MSELSLDDVLEGKEHPEETETVETESTGEEEQAAAAEPEEEVTTEPEEKKPGVDPEQFKGYLDEREKRQNAERERDELRKQLEAKQPEPEAAIDPVDDPQGFQDQQAQRFAKDRFEDAFELMSETKPDLQEAWDWAGEATKDNPILLSDLSKHQGKPVALLRAVHKAFTQHKEMEERGDMDAFLEKERERIREEERSKLLAEQGKQQEAAEQKQTSDSKGIDKPSTVTTGTSQSIGQTGEMTLEDVVGADIRSRPK